MLEFDPCRVDFSTQLFAKVHLQVKWCLVYFMFYIFIQTNLYLMQPALLAHSYACPTCDQKVAGFSPCQVCQHFFVAIDHEIFSAVILSLPLIQGGQLSVFVERM